MKTAPTPDEAAHISNLSKNVAVTVFWDTAIDITATRKYSKTPEENPKSNRFSSALLEPIQPLTKEQTAKIIIENIDTFVGDETPVIEKYFDEAKYLNGLKCKQ